MNIYYLSCLIWRVSLRRPTSDTACTKAALFFNYVTITLRCDAIIFHTLLRSLSCTLRNLNSLSSMCTCATVYLSFFYLLLTKW